jgi:hypothetical protein
MKPIMIQARHGAEQHQKEGARYTIRLKPRQNARLKKMGRVEKRHFADFFRSVMNKALDEWQETHPCPAGRKLKIVP